MAMQFFIRSLLFVSLALVKMSCASAPAKGLTQAEFDAHYPCVRPLVHDEFKRLGWSPEDIASIELKLSKENKNLQDTDWAASTVNNKKVLWIPTSANQQIASGDEKTILRIRGALGHEGGHLANRDTIRQQAFQDKLIRTTSLGCLGALFGAARTRNLKLIKAASIAVPMVQVSTVLLGSLAHSRYIESRADEHIRNDINVLQAWADYYRGDDKEALQEITKKAQSGCITWAEIKKGFGILKRQNRFFNLADDHPTCPSVVKRAEERIEMLKRKSTQAS